MGDILIVDDDPEVLGTVERALTRDGFQVTAVSSVNQARQALSQKVPDLVVLDIMMPGEDGLSLCREVRMNTETQSIPVLFLSARARVNEVVEGLDAGGDDYLAKPFHMVELTARVRALLRRQPASEQPLDGTMTVGDLTLDFRKYRVCTATQDDIQLTSTEFKLLHHLMRYAGQAHSASTLLDVVWGYPEDAGDPDLVRAHIRNLRVKIEPDQSNPIYIRTIHGVGYLVNLADNGA